MPVFYDFILQPERLGSQSLLADHTPAASQNVFFPPVPNHETEGDFLSKVYFDTLIPTSAAAGPCIGAVFVRSYPGQPQGSGLSLGRIPLGSAPGGSWGWGDKSLCI